MCLDWKERASQTAMRNILALTSRGDSHNAIQATTTLFAWVEDKEGIFVASCMRRVICQGDRPIGTAQRNLLSSDGSRALAIRRALRPGS